MGDTVRAGDTAMEAGPDNRRDEKLGSIGANAVVTLRLDGGRAPIVIKLRPSFGSEAMRWAYVARSRDRWSSKTDPGAGQGGPLRDYLDDAQLKEIGASKLVEVTIPFADAETDGWALRVFPWEYALSAVTREFRSEPLTVWRCLARNSRNRTAAVGMAKVATVEACPAGLSRWYNVKSEGDLMLSSFGLPATHPLRLTDPTCESAREWLKKNAPSVIHIAGVDTHQAVALLGLEGSHPSRGRRDGLAMRGGGGEAVDMVSAERFAALCNAGDKSPDLVMCNFYNSAARIAARTVAKGAKFAIGYHDTIEDGLAAVFCTTLYSKLVETNGDMLTAFKAGIAGLRAQPNKLRGACIVLWTSVSLMESASTRKTTSRASHAVTYPGASDVKPWERVFVECEPIAKFNYSLLHNRQSIFRALRIFRKQVQGDIRDIEVIVDLNAGEGSFPFRKTLELKSNETGKDLTREIVLPLTSSLIRRQSERIQSSLRVQVLCDGHCVKQETYRIGLSPVDEWQDGEKDEWRWLPSFVLPRDPAVAKIIDSAQSILTAIADDPTAGFDGYQSIGQATEPDETRYAAVDRQVQAIWHALLNAHGLSYINPPPSYGYSTQRLRTPTQILQERRGTCIDLALLLASCLEYIDIYPVIFLLTGHAFVGYWRSDALHSEFLKMKGIELTYGAEEDTGSDDASEASAGSMNPGYVLDRSQHSEVRERVYQRQIIPLEATWLTSRGAFEASATEGVNNLRRAREFAAMIDVRLARDRDVTPLPLLGGIE